VTLVSLRSELETVLRYEAGGSEPVRKLMLAAADKRSPGELCTNEWLQALFALHLGLRLSRSPWNLMVAIGDQ
jgi:hypothetical protein